MNKHINKKKLTPQPKITLQVPFGSNRKQRRTTKAQDKKLPQIIRKMKIERNIRETKQIGRKIQALKLKNK